MRVVWLAGATLAVLAAACSSCGSDETLPAPDAGNDAGGSGGASTGGIGGSSSGGKDGGTGGDASVDAGPDAYGPGWELAPWSPPGCQILRATDLATTVPPLVWKDCQNGIAGCVYLDTSSLPGDPTGNGDKIGQYLAVTRRSGATFFSIGAKYGEYDHGPVIYEVGIGPRAAWKSDVSATKCNAGGVVFGNDGGAAIHFSRSVDGGITSGILYSKTENWKLDDAPILTVDQSLTGKPLLAVMDVRFSSSLMALQMGLDSLIYTWDFGPGTPALVPRPSGIAEDYGAIVKASEMVFVRDSPTATARTFAVRHADGTIENLYKKPSVWAISLVGDGVDFAWQELDQTTGVLELWTAPWTTSPTTFSPKKVRTIDGNQGLLVAAGFAGEKWWVYGPAAASLRAVRLSDGAYLDAPAPKGYGWLAPFGVVDGEIWALFGLPPAGQIAYSVARVPIASLGVPHQ